MIKKDILQILREIIVDLTDEPIFHEEKKRLFGGKGIFDSLDFVRFLVSAEKRINDVYNSSILLVDDRAMSQEHSPFLNLDSLANYIRSFLDENGFSDRS